MTNADELFEEELERFRGQSPADQQLLIGLLRRAQELYGCVPEQAQRRICTAAGVPSALVAALIRRVPALKSEVCRYELTLCTGPRCMARGSAALLARLEDLLGISPGQTTPDGLFRLRTQNCMKRCGAGPNLSVNGTIRSGVLPEELPALLEALARGEEGLPSPSPR